MQYRKSTGDWHILVAILVGGVLSLMAITSVNANTGQSTSTVTVTSEANATPTIDSLSLNQGNDIILTENTFKIISATGTISDTDGCDQVASPTAVLYSNDVTSSCSEDVNTCYFQENAGCETSNCTPGGGDTNLDYQCDFKVWYPAQPTDDTAPTSTDFWEVLVTVGDGTATVTATNTNQEIDVSTLFALNVDGTIPYGTVGDGSDTGSTTQTVTITDTGNVALDVEIGGDTMCSDYPTCGGDTIIYSQQRFDKSSKDYSLLNFVLSASSSPADIVMDLVKPTATTSAVTDDTFWGIAIPGGQASNSYEGLNYFIAIIDGFAAALPKTFQATCWDDTGGSRSCTGTGEDGEIQYGVSPPNPRFTDNGDGTVIDNYTGIIWLKNADCFGDSQWQTALDNAAGLNTGECGLTDGSSAGDWSLPNTWQLSSLQDHEESGPGLPSGHPFTNVFNGTYWTGSTRVSLTGWAITFSMNNPHLDLNDKDVATGRTWPMRLSGSEDETPVRLPKTGLTSCWDDTGASRSCSGTGEDGENQFGVTCPSPRFTDNGDGTVTDNCTDLVWLKNGGCFTGKLWQTALNDAAGLNTGECGLTDGSSAGDWALPNFYQIMSLVDFQNQNPSLPSGHPFTNVQVGCHAGTTITPNKASSWGFNFNGASFAVLDKDVDAGCAWPVKKVQ